jgi:FkbM family methyltransferase
MLHLLPASIRRKIRLAAWHRLNLSWPLASGITIEIASPADWEAYNEIFVDGEYDPAILSALETGKREQRALTDLGSNLGFFCLRVLHLAHTHGTGGQPPAFTMVEGSQRVLDELRRRKSYPLLSNHAEIVHGLVGNRTGLATLYESDMHLFNSIMDKGGSGSSVPYVDLEQRLAHCERVDLMKCDIQGAEVQFLENYPALLRKASVAIFELHHFLCDTARCMRLLEAAGFQKMLTLRQNEAVSVVCCERQISQGAGGKS